MGRLLDALAALPGDVAQHTAVVVTADHGEAFAEHGRPARGGAVEELVRVPMIVYVPGMAPRRVDVARSQIHLRLDLLSSSDSSAGRGDARR